MERRSFPLVLVFLIACGSRLPTQGLGEIADDTGDTAETGGGGESSGEGGESAGEESGGGASCGNGIIEVDETCDGDNLDGQTCEDYGFLGGELACSDDCTIDATGCSEQLCGNGMIEGDEECDGMDFGGINCTDLGFGPGLPLCSDDCTFDTSTCTTPGEGEMCSLLGNCPDDLHCVNGTCYDGSAGDPCENDFQCDSGDCDGETLFQAGTCL